MSAKSWLTTLVPLFVYLIGFAYSLQSGVNLSDDSVKLLEGILYAFIGSAGAGAIASFARSRKPQ